MPVVVFRGARAAPAVLRVRARRAVWQTLESDQLDAQHDIARVHSVDACCSRCGGDTSNHLRCTLGDVVTVVDRAKSSKEYKSKACSRVLRRTARGRTASSRIATPLPWVRANSRWPGRSRAKDCGAYTHVRRPRCQRLFKVMRHAHRKCKLSSLHAKFARGRVAACVEACEILF